MGGLSILPQAWLNIFAKAPVVVCFAMSDLSDKKQGFVTFWLQNPKKPLDFFKVLHFYMRISQFD